MKPDANHSPEVAVVDDTPVIHATVGTDKIKKVKIGRPDSWRGSSALIVMALFVLVGGYFLVRSFASTATVTKTWATQADWGTGTLSNAAISNNTVTLTPQTTTSAAPSTTATTTADVALNRSVSVSSSASTGKGRNKTTYWGSYANDGSSSTAWISQSSDPQWIYVDLGSSYNVSEVKLNWSASNYAKSYVVQVSNDANTWTTISTNTTGDGGIDDLTGLSGTGRYVRVYGNTHNGSNYTLYDFNVYATVNSTSSNLAKGKTVSVSSANTDGSGVSLPGSNAVDGNASTRWSSAYSDPQWITVDLGSSYNINQVKLSWETAYAKDYIIEVSPDNSTWSTIYRANGAGDGGIDDLSGLSGTGRYVRMYGSVRATQWGYSLYEFEVYGTPAQASTYATDGSITLTYDGDTGTSSTGSVAWSSLAPTTSLPANTSISYQARTSSDKTNWSTWAPVTGSLSGLANSRYIQIQASLHTGTNTVTPVLQKLVLTYVVTTADPAPTVTLTATPNSVTSGTAATLSWNSTNATSCTASGSWSGTQATSGSASTGNLTANSTYNLSCSGPGGSVSATASVTVAQPTTGSPSGLAMPVGDVTSGGHTWHQILKEDFTKDAPLGSWNDSGTLTACPSEGGDAVRYTGNEGTKWASYPKCYLNTDHVHHYRSDQTLSVHDGTLDYWLHSVNGVPTSANPGPIMPDGTRNQTYGRYEVRMKTSTTALSEFYVAWLLWPKDSVWTCGESDYPESNLGNTTVNAFAHWNSDPSTCQDVNRRQDAFSTAIKYTDWHTYTQEWMPGKRNYYLDGVLIGTSTSNVYNGPERWQLQTEVTSSCDSGTTNTCTQDGHLLVDWATVYSY